LKVVLVYDATGSCQIAAPVPEDLGAEYEDDRTIDALLASIGACGHEVTGLVFDEDFVSEIRRLDPDLVFNIAEGVRGPMRESIVPAWLDHLGIGYTGSDGLTLALSLDKSLTKTLAADRGVRTPAFRRIRTEADLEDLDLELPLFVKPNGEGSSMGIRGASKVDSWTDLERQVSWVLNTYEQDCLVEEFAPGSEYCVGIVGNDDPQFLPIVEIRCEGGFYSYEAKSCHKKELICPSDVPAEVADQMRRSALTMYRILSCRDFARVDFRIDREGFPTFLEINPLPGLSPYYSIFTYQAAAAGLTHQELVGQIIDLAMDRLGYHQERTLT